MASYSCTECCNTCGCNVELPLNLSCSPSQRVYMIGGVNGQMAENPLSFQFTLKNSFYTGQYTPATVGQSGTLALAGQIPGCVLIWSLFAAGRKEFTRLVRQALVLLLLPFPCSLLSSSLSPNAFIRSPIVIITTP